MSGIKLALIVPTEVIVFYNRYPLGDLVDCIANKAIQRNFEKLALCHGEYIEKITNFEKEHPNLTDDQKRLTEQIVETEKEISFSIYLNMIRVMYRDFVLQVWIKPSRFFLINLWKVFNFRINFNKNEAALAKDVFVVEQSLSMARYQMMEDFVKSIY